MIPVVLDDDTRWAAIVARDRTSEHSYVYSVRTTGVYCRPTCGARLPRRENVAFHDSATAAEAAGFRPCRRCRPNESSRRDRNAALVAQACRRLEAAATPPRLDALARSVGLSPHHFHRLFKAVTGLTPKAYADALRGERARRSLARGDAVTTAIYDAGYNSSSRFYARSRALLGMTPSQFRSAGERMRIRYGLRASSLGLVLVATTDDGVCAILLGDDRDALVQELRQRFRRAELEEAPEFDTVLGLVVRLVEEPWADVPLPLDIRGTAFQQRVWQALRDIPAGGTAADAELAARIGCPTAVRSAALACGANALAVAIPCHRVVRSDGDLAGYRGSAARKRLMIERESGATPPATSPAKPMARRRRR